MGRIGFYHVSEQGFTLVGIVIKFRQPDSHLANILHWKLVHVETNCQNRTVAYDSGSITERLFQTEVTFVIACDRIHPI